MGCQPFHRQEIECTVQGDNPLVIISHNLQQLSGSNILNEPGPPLGAIALPEPFAICAAIRHEEQRAVEIGQLRGIGTLCPAKDRLHQNCTRGAPVALPDLAARAARVLGREVEKSLRVYEELWDRTVHPGIDILDFNRSRLRPVAFP